MENSMLEITNGSLERMRAALELLALKARRMNNDNLHCFIDGEDVEEILAVAGMNIEGLLEKEAPPCLSHTTN